MLAHIGTIMRYLGREEHLQWMLSIAKVTYPNDANVAKALTHPFMRDDDDAHS